MQSGELKDQEISARNDKVHKGFSAFYLALTAVCTRPCSASKAS
jgi:hypothetical protein